jgi:2-dehydropantoate 2-reductase
MHVGVFGAGAIGCYVGGRLLAAGTDVTFVGRASVAEGLERGLVLSDQSGARTAIPRERVRFELEPPALLACDLVFVTVKSSATEQAGKELSSVLGPKAIIVSLQNGVKNAARLRGVLGDHPRVLGGMVPFNVTRTADGRFHRGTSGPIVIEDRSGEGAEIASLLARAEVAAHATRDIEGVLYGKLLFNLNNALNALAGVPLKQELLDPGYRALLADSITEGRRVLAAAGIIPRASGRMLPSVAAFALRLPTWLFQRVAQAMVAIDAEARSSMYDDLDRRRPTEIDELNGEIVRLGAAHGIETPVSSAIVRLVKEAEARAEGSPRLSAEAIRRAAS